MSRLVGLVVVAVVVVAVATAASAGALSAADGSPVSTRCRPTPTDAFGPFGRGTPPFRSRIGRGHVLKGVVLSALGCAPLARARVELWQSNRFGRYTRATSASVLTDRNGRFRFEGPFPPSYEGRAPHIHVRVFARGHELLMTRVEPRRGTRRTSVRWVLRPALV